MHVLTARSGRVRGARKLRMGKFRRETGLFLVEGPQSVAEALAARAAVEVFVDSAARERLAALQSAAESAGVDVHVVDSEALASLSDTTSPQGVVATATWAPRRLPEVVSGSAPGQVALAHRMADPGNAGALIRVADASGALLVALSEGSVDPTNPKCVRSTAGSLFHLPVVPVADTVDAISWLQHEGFRALAADVTANAVDLFDAERAGAVAGRIVWVFGNEAHGLPPEVLRCVDLVVRIPILGRAESLNVATAAAVCLYSGARALVRTEGWGNA